MLKTTGIYRVVGRAASLLMAAVALLVTVSAQESGQKTFTSLPDASKALYDAVKSGDKSAMEAVLGASSAPILSSGDPVQDKKNVDNFIQRYEQMNRWGKETNGDETLFLGAENWPLPDSAEEERRRTVVFRQQGRRGRGAVPPHRKQ